MKMAANPIIYFSPIIKIQVKAFLAANSENFSFNMVTKNGNRIKQKTIDAVTEEEVERADCSKGYEYEKDKFIIFTDDDLAKIALEKNNVIEIVEYINPQLIDYIRIEKCYYLSPDRGVEKLYNLFATALHKTDKIAIGKWYNRCKDNLIALASDGKSIKLFQLYYRNEIRTFSYEPSDKFEPTVQEIDLAKKLIRSLSSKTFDDSKYADEFAGRIRNAIDNKINNISISNENNLMETKSNVMSLVSLLEASIKKDDESK